jgi:hypothetical protein
MASQANISMKGDRTRDINDQIRIITLWMTYVKYITALHPPSCWKSWIDTEIAVRLKCCRGPPVKRSIIRSSPSTSASTIASFSCWVYAEPIGLFASAAKTRSPSASSPIDRRYPGDSGRRRTPVARIIAKINWRPMGRRQDREEST